MLNLAAALIVAVVLGLNWRVYSLEPKILGVLLILVNLYMLL